jgi:transposase InsO family protein
LEIAMASSVTRDPDPVGIARSSFYAWLAAADGRAVRHAADEALVERIRAVHTADGTYGARRVNAELNDGVPEEQRVNHKLVARVMRTAGIGGYRRRRWVTTTQPDPAAQKVPDLLNRDFTAAATNATNVGDITYLPLATGSNLYLATVIDWYSGRVAGWAIAEHMRTELVEDALKAAHALRGSLEEAVFSLRSHSQYTSKDFAKQCRGLGVTQSKGAVGTSADNAVANHSTQPSNVKSYKMPTAGLMLRPAAARCPGDWPATTPNDGTPDAVTSA